MSSATTAGAVKVLIEGAGLGLAAYRDRVPEDVNLPYVSIMEGLALIPDKLETSDGGYRTCREIVQIDLWQQWRDPSSRAITENYTLAPALTRLLEGSNLPSSPQVVYGVLLTNRIRQLELDNNIVHDTLTVQVWRQL